MDINLLVAAAIIVLLMVIAGAMLARLRPTGHLAYRFGPEHERDVPRAGKRRRPERRGHR